MKSVLNQRNLRQKNQFANIITIPKKNSEKTKQEIAHGETGKIKRSSNSSASNFFLEFALMLALISQLTSNIIL